MISEFTKEKVFWTRKMNLKLVNFMKNRPNIWNPKHPKYTSVVSRDKTYAEFAQKYSNEFTGQAVKDRWTNIRSTFANYLRKVKSSKVKGEEYKVNWPLWEPCQFLLKVNRQCKTVSKTNGIEDMDPYNKDLNLSSEDFHISSDSSSSEMNTNYNCKALSKNLLKVFKGVQNDSFGIENTKNGEVGRLVMNKLSEMTSFEAAKASVKIMEILLLYDSNNPLNPVRINENSDFNS